MKIFLAVLLLACVAVISADQRRQLSIFHTKTVDYVLSPTNKKPVEITGCGKEITEPLGTLTRIFVTGQSEPEEKCIWHLHAPINHVVNIVSNEIEYSTESLSPVAPIAATTPSITFFDGLRTQKKELFTLNRSTEKDYNSTIHSTSSGQDMTVELNYRELKDYSTQEVRITYEFVNKLLRG